MNIQSFHGLGQSSYPSTVPYIPLYACPVSAGFPSPADDHIQKNIDLNEELISNPIATFFVRVKGHSMKGASINNNDVLIVDRSLAVKNGDIVVAEIDGEITVKRFNKSSDKIVLQAENPEYPPLVIANERDFSIWGVVTTVIHSFRSSPFVQ